MHRRAVMPPTPGGSRNHSAIKRSTPRKRAACPSALLFLLLVSLVAILIVVLAVSSLERTPESIPRYGPHNIQQPQIRLPPDQPDQKKRTITGYKQPEKLKDKNDTDYYMVFSTGCSAFQNWQSYLFFYRAWKVQQPGQVVRIASGCKGDEEEILKKVHEEHIKIMSDRFHLHLTPDFSRIKRKGYKFFNKPFGLRHWMEHSLGYPGNRDADDAVVMILDPDQILLRPMTRDFSNSNVVWHNAKGLPKPKTRVEHGSPFAQLYGFARQPFTKVNLTYVAGENSPAADLSMQQQLHYYPAGPPYLATGRDMYNIAVKWTDFVPRVHDLYPHLLAEMFGYSIAAAHLKLPNQLAHSFMVSDVASFAEGWQLIDPTPVEKVCEPKPYDSLPYVLHYCQRYWLGKSFCKWFIGKYRLDGDFISCDHALLAEVPNDVGLHYDYYIAPGGIPYGTKVPLKPKHVKRNVFMLCTMIPALNQAATYFKKHHCNSTANFDKTYIFHDVPIENMYGPKKQDSEKSVQHRSAMQEARKEDLDYHVAFSTACSDFQNWQSYVFFFHAWKVQQPGNVTRIASGCSNEEARNLRDFHEKSIRTMSDRFHLHLTPDFSGIRRPQYKYLNKPYGLRHWMENALGIGSSSSRSVLEDGIVFLMDPDMILLRPIAHNFSVDGVIWGNPPPDSPGKSYVHHGNPMAQRDGYLSNEWTGFNITNITGDASSPANAVNKNEPESYYNAGPPYIATVKDMYSIAVKWTEFAPKVHDEYPQLFAEMYGYIIAAAHIRRPHQLMNSLVVSTTKSRDREGWPLVDALPADQACRAEPTTLPAVLHYCQRYLLGKWFFSKYRLRTDFISCDAPLLAVPPADLALKYDYSLRPPPATAGSTRAPPGERLNVSQKLAHREAFMVCHMISALNEAAEYFKRENCDGKGNYSKTYNFFDPPYF